MPLAAEQVYNELNGEEVKQILLQRVKDLLDQVPDFQRHLTLPRVKMIVNLHLDIYGRRVPFINLANELTLATKTPDAEIEVAQELSAVDEISADTGIAVPNTPFDGTGQPPDELRDQHQIPILSPVRDRTTRQTRDRPQERENTNPPGPGGKPWAGYVELDRGGAVSRGNTDYQSVPEIKEVKAQPDVGIQKDFRGLSERRDENIDR